MGLLVPDAANTDAVPGGDRMQDGHKFTVFSLALVYISGEYTKETQEHGDIADKGDHRQVDKAGDHHDDECQNHEGYRQLVAAVSSHHESSEPIHCTSILQSQFVESRLFIK